jgi:hypothetical protein
MQDRGPEQAERSYARVGERSRPPNRFPLESSSLLGPAARGLAACLTSDADNLLLCITARGLRGDLTIVARGYEEESLQKLHRAGADHAISPNVTGGIRMASTLIRPSVVSFLDVSTTGTDIELRMEQAKIPQDSELVGRSLADALHLGMRRSGLAVKFPALRVGAVTSISYRVAVKCARPG